MEREYKLLHDHFWIGDQITMENETVLVEEAIVFGGRDYSLTELKVIDLNGNTLIRPVDMFKRKIISHTDEQTAVIRFVEKLIKNRLMESGQLSITNFKDEGINYEFERLTNRINCAIKYENSPTIYVNDERYLLSNYAAVSSKKGEGIIAYLTNEEKNEKLLNVALYSEVIFEVSFFDDVVKYMGNIVRIEPLKSGYLLYIHPYPLEIMQTTRIGSITWENGIHPGKLMEFLVNSVDSDVKEIEYPGKELQKVNEYIVAGIIRNLDINIDNFTIGSVRFGETIKMSQKFDETLKTFLGEKTVAWVNVKEKTLYEAYKKGRELICAACDLLEFALKSDIYNDWYGTESDGSLAWDIRNHVPKLELEDLFYIENCMLGENITIIDNKFLTPAEIRINKGVEELFEKDWIDDLFSSIQQNKQNVLRLQYAMKWIIQAWHTDNPYDRLIYCSMALEFIVNGEKGNNIFNEYAIKNGRDLFTKREKSKLINTILDEINLENVDGLSQDFVEELNQSIRGIIRNSLSQASFNTKLESLVERLKIPVSDDEKKILYSARRARNDLIHGIEMQSITTLEAKKLCGVTSRILAYKIIEKTEEEN